jgi:plastocyanin
MIRSAKFALVAGCLLWAGAVQMRAQTQDQGYPEHRHPPKDDTRIAQIVALDECDPTTFNAMLGPGFCKNIALGAFTTFTDLFKKAAAGTPDPNWDFEPDVLKVREGTNLSVVNQGGEPHTFTEVAHFGGGFINDLNGGEETVPECADGFSNLAVARTRILQGSTVHVTDLSKGKHHFQCCIHPWMRVTVDVK